MKKFLIALCLAVVASASAKPAYNYQAPRVQPAVSFKPQQQQQVIRPSQPASNSGVYSAVLSQPISFPAPAAAPIGLPAPAPAQQFAQQLSAPISQFTAPAQQFSAPAPQFTAPAQQFTAPAQQFNAPAPQFTAPAQQFSAPVQQQQQQQQFVAPAPVAQFQHNNFQSQQPQQQTIISKDIYIHSAPEEVEEIGNEPSNRAAGPIRKNYRIVFIKAPSQNLKLNLDALKRNQASNEEKTVIYVLSKKPDLTDIQSQLSAVQTEQKAHKPEVYFIKYKTQEEANRAQQEIQAQYDSLGGSTHISDEGVAPVTSVIGGGSINVGNIGAGIGATSYQSGNSFGQQQFVQQTYQSSVGSSSSNIDFGGVPSQKYLPAKKK